MTPVLVECTVYGWEIGDTVVYTLEVAPVLGSSLGGSRKFKGGDGVGVLGNNLSNYR